MKNLAVGILLVTAVVFGGLYLQQSRKASQAQQKVDSLQQEVRRLQSSLEDEEQRSARLVDELGTARAGTPTAAQGAAQRPASPPGRQPDLAQGASPDASGSANAKPSNPLSEMFKNPEMKEVIKHQARATIGTLIDRHYVKLFADLHLTPEQSSALKEMVVNRHLGGADVGLSIFSNDMDATKRAELVQQARAAHEAGEAQIQEFLGDDAFTQFQDYEKSMSERMAVGGFKDQLGTGPTALTGEQEQQLIAAMAQERENFRFTTDLADRSKFTGDLASMFTADRMNTYLQELAQLNQQYLNQAQGILTPDQFAAFGKYLQNQQAMQKAGMQMAVKMFAPAKPGGD
jgi:hypothetical protein